MDAELSRAARRRVLAVQRLTQRVLGMTRRRWALGSWGAGGSFVLLVVVGVGDPNVAFAQYAAGNAAPGNSGSVAISGAGGAAATAGGTSAVAIGPNAVASSPNDIAVGSGSTAAGGTSVAVGQFANATGANAAAFGNGAQATGVNAIAIGVNSHATAATSGLSVGSQSFATGQSSEAFGGHATSTGAYTQAIGDKAFSNGTSSLALGQFTVSSGIDSIAIGGDAMTGAQSLVDNGIAIGASSIATNIGDVALGAGSVTTTPVGTLDVTVGTTTFGPFAGATPTSSVSVGAPGAERQIQNVAAGQITAASTDAINGSELFAADAAIARLNRGFNVTTAATGTGTVSGTTVAPVMAGSTQTVTAGNNIAIIQTGTGFTIATNPTIVEGAATLGPTGLTLVGGPSVTTTGGVNAGGTVISNVAAGVAPTDAVNVSQLTATNAAITTLNQGFNVTTAATGTGTVSGMTVAAVVPGSTQTVTAGNNLAITQTGTGFTVATNPTIVEGAATLGSTGLTLAGGPSVTTTGGINAGGTVISNLAPGVAPTDAVDVAQLTGALMGVTATAGNSVQYDNPGRTSVTLGGAGATTPVALNNVAPATLAVGSTGAVNGGQLYATNTNVTNLLNGAAGPFQSNNAAGAPPPSVTGANASAGGFGAVASGSGSVALGNGAKSSGTNSVALGAGSTDGGVANVVSLGSPGGERQLTNLAPGTRGTDGVNLNQLELLGNQFSTNLNSAVLAARAGTALSLSAAGLRYDERPGTTSIAGGGSYYYGHEGIAFGLGHTSDDGNWRYNLAATFVTPSDRAQVGVFGGVSYTFGH